MKQIIFIGFSTTGKSTLIDKIAGKYPHRTTIDTDKAIAKGYKNNSISSIYYEFDDPEDAHKKIEELEIKVLSELTKADNNFIIAAGPGIPLRAAFGTYIKAKVPHVVLIEKPVEEIYESLISRRNEMKSKQEHQRPDFGIWDLGIMVKKENGIIVDLPRSEAIENIKKTLHQRFHLYNKYATLKIKSSDIFSENLPQGILDIL